MYRRTALLGLSLMAIRAASGEPAAAVEALVPAAGTEIRFELRDTQGKTVSSTDLRGLWVLAFFGYTSCPDICPTTLFDIAQALAHLGPLAARVQPLFISVDPQRDTPKKLREYVNDFDERILPLTGTAEQLDRAARSFGVAFFKVPGASPNDYTIAHGAIITLIGPEGGLVTRFSTNVSADQIASKLGRLIDMNALNGPSAWRGR
jgi:protein SCO1